MKCAIVGNSGILLDKEWGKLIDSHDVILRINMAKTESYEKHVGSKTDIRFCNLHPVMCRLSDNHLKEHMKFFPQWDNDFILSWKNQKLFFKNAGMLTEGSELNSHLLSMGNEIYHIPEQLIQEIKNIIGAEPTMGILSIIFSISNFETVNCFGFDFYQTKNKFHYFENVIPYESCHDNSKEKEFIFDLADNGKINLYR